jgi:PhoD-like phosphatase
MIFPLVAAVPYYGVSMQRIGGQITLIADDSGARGYPHKAGLLAIQLVDGKAQIVLDGGPVAPPYDVQQIKRALGKVRNTGKVPPYRLTVDQDSWPVGGDYVLVLFFFLQSQGIGNEELFIQQGVDESEMPDKFDRERADAVNILLQRTRQRSLNAGLIRQYAATPASLAPALPGANGSPAKAPATTRVTFALASCQYPSDVLDQMPKDVGAIFGPPDAALYAFAKLCNKTNGDRPTLLLLAGDQVYIDATAGMFDPTVLDDKYRIPYQRRGQSRGVQELRKSGVEVWQMPDDHEIIDNWDAGESTPQGEQPAIQLGKAAYWQHQRHDRPVQLSKLWHAETHEGLPFFLADTRTQREARTVDNLQTRGIMSAEQFIALKNWLTAPHPEASGGSTPKFVCSASTLLPRSLAVARCADAALHSDAWDGYPQQMHELLAHVCDKNLQGVVFLSGDAHISFMATGTIKNLNSNRTCTVHSVHSSALYAPYPFANASPQDFARSETVKFKHADVDYEVVVCSFFTDPGDGFAVLTAARNNAHWQLQVVFHNARGAKNTQAPALMQI